MGYSRLPLVAKKLIGTVDICQKRYNLQISTMDTTTGVYRTSDVHRKIIIITKNISISNTRVLAYVIFSCKMSMLLKMLQLT